MIYYKTKAKKKSMCSLLRDKILELEKKPVPVVELPL